MSRAVLVTRHPADCVELQQLLTPAGITVRPYPVLRIEELDDSDGWRAVLSLLAQPDVKPWLVMSSPRAPQRLVRLARHHGAKHLLDCSIAVVGDTTAEAAAEAGLGVDHVGPGSGAGLAKQLIERLDPACPVVLACGKERRHELPKALAEAGHPVHPVVVYSMRATPPRELPPLGPNLEAVILTSPRAARLYIDAVGGKPLPLQHWALGPTTRDAAGGLGIECAIPSKPTMYSLAEELCQS